MLKHVINVIKENVTLVNCLPELERCLSPGTAPGLHLSSSVMASAACALTTTSRLPLISVQTAMTMTQTDNFHVFFYFLFALR